MSHGIVIRVNNRNRIQLLYIAATALSVTLAYVLFTWGQQGLFADAEQYYIMGQQIAREGLSGFTAGHRTYGYPLFVAIVWVFTDHSPWMVRFAIFNAQLSVLLIVCFYSSRLIQGVFNNPGFSLAIYASTILNPFLLVFTTEVLSDLLSAVLVFLAIMLSVQMPLNRRGRLANPSFTMRPSKDHYLRNGFFSFFLAGLAVMVRPSNLPIVSAVILIWLVRGMISKDRSWQQLVFMVVGFGLPFVPQVIHNFLAYNAIQPLAVQNVYTEVQLPLGMELLKASGFVIQGLAPRLDYANPFFAGDVSTPLQFIQKHPFEFLLTTGIHSFAFFDYDFLFPYNVDPNPWYRWPLSIVNYAFLFTTGVGITLLFKHWLHHKHLSRVDLVFFGLLVAGVVYFSLFAVVAIESRFSLPEYLLLAPFFVYSIGHLRGVVIARRWKKIGIMGLGLGIFIAGSVLLSSWIAVQAPTINLLDMSAVHDRLIQNSLSGKLGSRVQLLGYTVSPSDGVRGGSRVFLTLAWQCAGGPIEQNELRVDLEDSEGRVWSQGIHDAGYNLCPSIDHDKEFGGRFVFRLPVTMPGGLYRIYLGLFDLQNQEYLPAVDATGKLVDEQVRVTDLPIAKDKSSITARQFPIENPYFVDMHEMRLLGYTQIPNQLNADSVLDLGLYWRARGKPLGDYTVIIQLRDSFGAVAYEHSARPADGTYPTTLWDAGEVLLDWQTIQLPKSMPSGDYALFVALRDASSNELIGEAPIAEISIIP